MTRRSRRRVARLPSSVACCVSRPRIRPRGGRRRLQARRQSERGWRAAPSGRRRTAPARAALSYDGWAYTVGDFAVGVGKATVRPGDELRGLMVEVEYLPAQLPHLAAAALQARAARPRAARARPVLCMQP